MNKEMKSAFKINLKEFRAILYTTRFNKTYDYILDTMDIKKSLLIFTKKLKE